MITKQLEIGHYKLTLTLTETPSNRPQILLQVFRESDLILFKVLYLYE